MWGRSVPIVPEANRTSAQHDRWEGAYCSPAPRMVQLVRRSVLDVEELSRRVCWQLYQLCVAFKPRSMRSAHIIINSSQQDDPQRVARVWACRACVTET